MNILMVIPYFKPEITAIIHLMEDLAFDFEKYGAQVTIVTGFPIRGLDPIERKKYYHKEVEQLSKNIKIMRVGSKSGEGNSLASRGFKYLAKTFVFYSTSKKVSADVIYLYSTPPSMGMIGAWLSKKVPTVYCLQDIFPDNLSAQGMIKKNSLIFKLFSIMEAYIYKNNTHIVTISKDMKRNLMVKKIDSNKITVIGNWIDTEELKYIPREENPLFDEYKLEKKGFYVSYCGNLGYAQDIDIILACAKVTLTSQFEIKYIIIGSGVYKEHIMKRIKEENINNIYVFPLRPEKDSAYVYSLGDIGLITLKKEMSGYAMPSKTWAMMSASQPLICTAEENTEICNTIRETHSGIVIKPGDYYELARQIIRLYREQAELGEFGRNGRLYAEKKLSRESATMNYFNLLSEVAGKARKK
ncbi:glycosyltransferase family 4 protein [Acidaminobacter hydrogenoformans]|uniref:Glycosyltransferase involved in cell wall bisynthesis n=1 Tax=Acidaminobacter hydrogenoformans DSM 2784 TaxID=1120920 RepID=A0A1G5RPQ5_9FIRM|nr:glycosyltransferase family 4 protein [Acidaminobacter hydrogenoformans]SCZ76092.1 Glycosyltransferase involved in cell wall bisynthesis [Acidaminobacter hydrogenoformans DSM 2784]